MTNFVWFSLCAVIFIVALLVNNAQYRVNSELQAKLRMERAISRMAIYEAAACLAAKRGYTETGWR